MLRKIFLALVITVVPSMGFAQQGQETARAMAIISPDGTSTCASTYSFGSGNTFFKFCVTNNGNITQFESPVGVEHIRNGTFAEGYSVCDVNANKQYYDYADAGDSGNWGAPVKTQPGGPNTFPLTIKRTTTDGLFTLTQTFSRVTGERIVKIGTTLKNNVPVAKPVHLIRFADVDANGVFSNYVDQGVEAACGYNPFQYGLMLYVATSTVNHFANSLNFGGGQFADSCSLPGNSSVTPALEDGSIYAGYNFSLGANAAKTVAFEYKRF